MTKDELKYKLRSAWVLQQQIDAYKIEIQNLRDNAKRITPAYSMALGGSGNGQRIENAMVKIVDAENLIRSDIELLMLALSEIRAMIATVDDLVLRLILHKRYLCYQKWEVIAIDLDYDVRWIHVLHSRALNKILEKTIC